MEETLACLNVGQHVTKCLNLSLNSLVHCLVHLIIMFTHPNLPQPLVRKNLYCLDKNVVINWLTSLSLLFVPFPMLLF